MVIEHYSINESVERIRRILDGETPSSSASDELIAPRQSIDEALTAIVNTLTTTPPVLSDDIANMVETADIANMVETSDLEKWNDINFPGANLGAGATAPDLVACFGGTILLRCFDGNATTEQLFSSDEMLHGYKEGTDIYFHVHWCPTTTDAGNVIWQLTYSWENVNEVMPTGTTIAVTGTASGVAWTHQLNSFPAISGTGKEIGSQFAFRLFRNPAATGDTYGEDAALLSCGIHYQVDGVGSSNISSK